MNPEKFFNFYYQFIFSPTKAFKWVAGLKKTTNLLIIIAVFLAIYNLLIYQLFPAADIPPSANPTNEAFNQFFRGLNTFFHNYGIITGIFGWILFNGLIFLIIRFFSKKGSFKNFLIAQGLITLLLAPLDLAVRFLNTQTNFYFLNLAVSGWGFYLGILAISLIFEISRKKAFLIEAIFFCLLVLFFLIWMFLSVSSHLNSN